MRLHFAALGVALGLLALSPPALGADPVPVRLREGVVHGFLVLKTLAGETIAEGDLIQRPAGDRTESRLVFHFHDGSLQDETATFTQQGVFRLETYHLVQKGPSFPHALEASLERGAPAAVVRHRPAGKDHDELVSESLPLPADAANGLVFVLLKNLDDRSGETEVGMVAFTPEPRLVKLAIARTGVEPFYLGSSRRDAIRYRLHIEIGGLAGFFAPLLGKEPPDLYVWLEGGEAPTFLRFEGPLFVGGPIWRMELGGPPRWPAREAEPTSARR